MSKKFFAVPLLFLVSLNPIAKAEEEQVWINVKRITLETALRIGKTAIDTCRKEGVNISVTVVDRAGQPQVMLRDVIAPAISQTISEQKAHAAVAFNSKTSQLEGRFKNLGSVAKTEGLIFSAGGVPIQAAGRILGGIGVSGAPSGELDEKCAQAGLDAVLDDLEMAE